MPKKYEKTRRKKRIFLLFEKLQYDNFIKTQTILQDMKIKFRTFLFFAHFYFYKTTFTKDLRRNLEISNSTILKLKKRIEDKIIENNKKETRLSGENVTVEIDESLIASVKYGRGYFPKQTWVFGIVERVSGRCYIQVVSDRSRYTLEKIIKNIVVDDTLIISDGAKAYDKLSELGVSTLECNSQ
ncbi:hypothetical protein DMUE_3492 [Dictyocoela muelleri]|nr:hypothetical protein DMUE_3492 [Dictyocoela muelleri]